MFKPELLSPAGTLKNMRYAFAYGADAVYAGQPRYSLRVRNNEFNNENLQIGIKEAHSINKKFYVVINIVPHNAKLKTFLNDLRPVINMKPDALIISDPGLIMLVRENFPEIPIHLSVQANTVNWATVKFWQQIGLTRVILSRELSLEEIEEIRYQVPQIEIEIFVHGALCMAYSGRCLLSSYISKRDPNQGACTNVCRWEYNLKEGKEDDMGNVLYKKKSVPIKEIRSKIEINIPTNQVFILEKTKCSNEHMIAFEDEHGTYILNSKDLCAVAHVEQLAKIGVNSLKIEGRTKSFYYCARTAQIYRKAIDDTFLGKPFDSSLLEELEGLAHRGYTAGFFHRHTHDKYQNYKYSHSFSQHQQFVGEFTGECKDDLVSIAVKNKFSVYDSLKLITTKGNIPISIEYMEDNRGEKMLTAPGEGYVVWALIKEKVPLNYALLVRNFFS